MPTTHTRWVRVSHWILAASLLTLGVSGYFILMVHPRLYWGETGNDLTSALLELPISRNHRHGGWEGSKPFSEAAAGAVTANRTFEIFNQNGWARSLHFLAAWALVIPGGVYLWLGISRGHFRTHLLPRRPELAPRSVGREVLDHLRLHIRPATGGPQYGVLQKVAYCGVVFVVMPLVVITGLAMSPAVTSALPFLLDLFGGFQSARTIHFLLFVLLAAFVIVHVAMVTRSGLGRQLRAMTLGEKR